MSIDISTDADKTIDFMAFNMRADKDEEIYGLGL
jgi:hypothetical protein